MRFDAKVSTIEEMNDLDRLTMDELYGILKTYEMRTEKEKSLKREATFKASKKTKNKEPESSDSSNDEFDTKKSHFVRKIKKGFGKYKGKLPFKCFNCCEIGHFAAKCPLVKSYNDDEEDHDTKKQKELQTR